jgi:hypothetical protein
MAYPNYVNYGYNAYSGGSTALLPYHQGDFSVDTLVYATGPLGFRYIDYSTSPTLLDAGDQSSAAAGLCHYTIVADQTLDGGTVDIGYHYYVPSQPFPNSQWVLTSVNTPTTIILSEGGCTDLSQNDTFTITDTPQPGGGSVAPTVGYGKVVYTPPNATFAGEDDFDFRVSNVGGSSYSTAQVRVFVVPPPQLSLTCLSDRIVLVWTIDSTLQNLEFPNPPFLQPYTDIYRYDNTGWHLIHTSDFDERAYVDTAVQPNLHYSYRVKIRYVDGWGNVSGTRYSNIPNSTTCPTKPAPIGLVTGNDANEDVKTINFSNGSLVNDFGPPGEFSYWTGRGLAIHNGEIFYSGVDSTFDFSDGIHVCNYGNSGSGASTDNRVLTNPRPSGFGIQDLAFHNNQLYVLTGYAENPLKVYQLDPVSGIVIGNPNGISITPAILDPVNGSPGTSDGFVVLPSGNFLINDFDGGEGCSVYREYNGTTGVLVTGGLVIDLKTYGYNSGTGVTLAPDGQSLYFMAHVERSFEFPHNAIIRTDLTGQLIGLQPLDDQTYGDSELEDIDVVFP